MESKENMGNMWRTLWKRWKTMGGQGGCPLLSSDFYYVKKMKVFVKWWCSSLKNAFFLYLTFLPKLSNFSLVFSLGLCLNGSATCSSYSSRNVTEYIKIGVKPWFLHRILIQLLYHVTAGGERKHANVRIVELRVALLLCGETLDKERDIRDAKSDTRVSNSGLTQAQLIMGVL